GGQAVPVRSGEAIGLRGIEQARYDVYDADREDEWEQWCRERDERAERSQSRRYVSEDVIGSEDLDEHGRWEEAHGAGRIWIPTYAGPGWAPYRHGHWSWVYPWGWTWVDDASWGFAPFHYGRWCYRRSHWAWVPGQVQVRAVYAPALVVFVGGGW